MTRANMGACSSRYKRGWPQWFTVRDSWAAPRKAMNFWNMVANKGLTLFTNILFNAILSDMETCYKCFRREIVQGMKINARGFEFEPEFTAKVLRQGIRIVEVPISYYGREYEEGKKIKWTDAPIAAWTLLRYRLFK